MILEPDEIADLRRAHDTGWHTLLTHVAELADAYRAQGYVMGDLAHDGTLRAQAEAEEA